MSKIIQFTITLSFLTLSFLPSAKAQEYFKQTFQLAEVNTEIEQLTVLIRKNSKDSDSWANRGLAYLNQHQYSNALYDLTQAINLNPKDPAYWHIRGMIHRQTNQHQKAIHDLTQAINIANQNGDIAIGSLSLRAEIYKNLGDCEKSNQDFLNYALNYNSVNRLGQKSIELENYYWCGEFKTNIQHSIFKTLEIARNHKARGEHNLGKAYHFHFLSLLDQYAKEFSSSTLMEFIMNNGLRYTRNYNSI